MTAAVLGYPSVDGRPNPIETSDPLTPSNVQVKILFAFLKDTFWQSRE